MRDTRVRVRIYAETTTFLGQIRKWWATLKRVLRDMARRLRDLVNPPSPERLWIRERGRAERAEANLWFARHIAASAA